MFLFHPLLSRTVGPFILNNLLPATFSIQPHCDFQARNLVSFPQFIEVKQCLLAQHQFFFVYFWITRFKVTNFIILINSRINKRLEIWCTAKIEQSYVFPSFPFWHTNTDWFKISFQQCRKNNKKCLWQYI